MSSSSKRCIFETASCLWCRRELVKWGGGGRRHICVNASIWNIAFLSFGLRFPIKRVFLNLLLRIPPRRQAKRHALVSSGSGAPGADGTPRTLTTAHKKSVRFQVNKRSRLDRRAQTASNRPLRARVSRESVLAEECGECLLLPCVLLRRPAEHVVPLTGANTRSPFIARRNALFRDYIDLLALFRDNWISVLPVSLIHTVVAAIYIFFKAFFFSVAA